MDRYRISQLADRVGLPATTLRYYEGQGLLPAQRTPGGYRTYDDTDVSAIARLDRLPDRDTPCEPTCSFLSSDTKARPTVQPVSDDTPGTTPPPTACSLTGSEYADRAARWRAVVAGTTRTRLPDHWVRVDFPAEQAEEIASLVAAESRCCPFFTFTLTLSGSGAVLDAHAPADAAPLLDELLRPDAGTPAC